MLVSEEARKTISKFRAMSRNSLFGEPNLLPEFIVDAPLALPRDPTNGIRKRDRDRAKRIKAVGLKPSLRERAVAFARERGEVRTKDLTDIGIPRCYLSRMCEEGLLEKIRHGRYRAVTR